MDHTLREIVELRFLISSNSASKITGDCIARLKKDLSITAAISGSYTQERVLALKGYDIRTLCSALEDILLSSQKSNVNESGVNWLLDENQVNYLTSHSIEHLNSILESSSTLIDVYVLNCPLSSERVIKVKGEPSSISHCIYDLYGLLKWCSVKKSVRPYHADNAQNTLASDYGGFGKDLLLQTSGANMKLISKETWETSSMKDVYLEQLNQAHLLVQSRKFPLSYSKKKDFVSDLVCKEFVLPLHLLPVVMGENGSRMDHISEESNTIIELKIDDRKSTCSFVIQGSSEEIENASHLMRLCIQILGKKTELPLALEP